MKIAVFDTYATRPDGRVMHFDVLVREADTQIEKVLQFGRRYLSAKGVPSTTLSAQVCRFCHVEESVTEPVLQAVEQDGFAIIEMGNCD